MSTPSPPGWWTTDTRALSLFSIGRADGCRQRSDRHRAGRRADDAAACSGPRRATARCGWAGAFNRGCCGRPRCRPVRRWSRPTQRQRHRLSCSTASSNVQGERWSLTANAGRSQSPTGRGVLTRRDEAKLSFNRVLHRTPEREPSRHAGSAAKTCCRSGAGSSTYHVDYARLDLGANWRLSRDWSLSLQLTG